MIETNFENKLKDVNVVLGITGSISAYKACDLCSVLKKAGANVDVIMTEHATEFVAPLTFETLTNNKVTVDMFDRMFTRDVKHIALAKKADIFVTCPASANIIAKYRMGLADDMLSSTFIATLAPKLVCPAMNVNMYNNPANIENMQVLADRGVYFLDPVVGHLACGDIGKGKLPDTQLIVNAIIEVLGKKKDLNGKKVVVSAGGTEEYIDGVRVITNHSSGKMGFAIAENAASRGADVTIVYGNVKVSIPSNISKSVNVKSTNDLLNAMKEESKDADIIIMAAAPSDYRVKNTFDNKIKSEELTLEFVKNPDIAKALGENKGNSKLVIFSAETENLVDNAIGKLKKKNADMVVANDVTKEGAGFNVDTNIATIIDKNGKRVDYPLMSKKELAEVIIDRVLEI